MKILVADDDAVTRRLVESALTRWGYGVVTACDGAEASDILDQPQPPRLVVLDWQMPRLDGVQLCRRVRSCNDEAYTYLILLTGNHDKAQVIEGLEAGADDYITKPFNPQELRVRIRNGKRILHLLEQLTSAREALRELAARDSLTSLWNHNSIITLLGQEMQRIARQDSSVAVALVDLDHFKLINDTHGHLVGDQVLCRAAESMVHCVRPYDAVGRYGGEEFLVVMPGCDEVTARSHGERLRLAVGDVELATKSAVLRITASVGVAVFKGDIPADPRAVIARADEALYSAKRAGRNRVHFAGTVDLANTTSQPLIHGLRASAAAANSR